MIEYFYDFMDYKFKWIYNGVEWPKNIKNIKNDFQWKCGKKIVLVLVKTNANENEFKYIIK